MCIRRASCYERARYATDGYGAESAQADDDLLADVDTFVQAVESLLQV